ncbi:MAG: L,D-transpeptidase family protein [Hyphomicrobiales bacterium]|nr:L,D-transpeptidase family protein [Hyphomicrobiales bacterium]
MNCALAQDNAPPSPSAPPAAAVAPSPTPAPAAAPAPTPVQPTAPTPAASAAPAPATSPAPPASTPALAQPAAAAPAPGSSAPAAAPIPVATAPKPKHKVAPPPPPLETALTSDPNPTFQPGTYLATVKAADRYAAIVASGGWPTNIGPLRPGARGVAVARLRRRLAIEGDLDASGPVDGPTAEVWDADLTAAVKHFQSRMGLRETGVVAGATLKAIQVPAETRLLQLRASAQRLSTINFSFGERYVVVNLPSTSVEAIENGRVVHRYVAIVGDPEHPSPEIAAHISVINLNPTWTVPTSIIKKEIIPRMQRDPGYLAREKIRILDGRGVEINPKSIDWESERAVNYILRQDSGAGNSLGAIRIGMPNKLAVYMHDTPSKRLFGADYRFLSHGCVRVQGVYDYAEWLLEGTSGGPDGAWDKNALLAEIKTGAREDIKLVHPVPVIWVYLTGWSNEAGVANFRDDVYGIDPQSEATALSQPISQADAPPPPLDEPLAPREPPPAPRPAPAAAPAPSGLFSLPLFAPFTPHQGGQ